MNNFNAMKGEPLCLLLVEDNPAHAELVIRSFQNQRVANKIYHVQDGEEALGLSLPEGETTKIRKNRQGPTSSFSICGSPKSTASKFCAK